MRGGTDGWVTQNENFADETGGLGSGVNERFAARTMLRCEGALAGLLEQSASILPVLGMQGNDFAYR